jgi:hypothetical protein
MALSALVLADLIQTNLQSFGANGSNLSKFCDAIGQGIVMSIIGQAFTTFDVGIVPGSGTGIGIGIIGLSASTMESIALSLMSSQGSNAANLMNAIMSAVVSHLSSAATLNSIDAPVYLGTGTIVIGSIEVTANAMSANILSQMQAQGANGSNLPNLCTAIGTGVANNIISSGTGTLVITGSGTPPPISGTGSGTGTIS